MAVNARRKRFVVRWKHRTKGWWHGQMHVSAISEDDAEQKVSQQLADRYGYPAADFDCDCEAKHDRRR